LKAFACISIAFLPMTPSFRERAIILQETTSKLSLTPFYVEALILMAFSYEMTIPALNTMVKIYIKINPGMMYFFVAQCCAMLMINMLRVSHRRSEDHRGFGASKVRASVSGLSPSMIDLRNDSKDVFNNEIQNNLLPPTTTTTKQQHDRTTSFDDVLHQNRNRKPVTNYDGYKQVTDDSGWIQQDSRDKQFKRDLRRAGVVVPMAFLANGLFFYVYFEPFIYFEATGILSRFITDNGPVSKWGFQDLADGLFKYGHPWSFTIVFAIALFVMLFSIPFLIAFCAAVDALLPLAPHWANRRPGGRASLVGRMRSSTLVQTLSDDIWVVDTRFALREAVEIFSTWGVAEACLIAAFFTVPNITNIAHWMFDETNPCPLIEDKTDALEKCITVKSHLLSGPGIALVAWVILIVILGRIVLDGQKGLSFLIIEDDEDSDEDNDSMNSALENTSFYDDNKNSIEKNEIA
jgi:hypothetical protein